MQLIIKKYDNRNMTNTLPVINQILNTKIISGFTISLEHDDLTRPVSAGDHIKDPFSFESYKELLMAEVSETFAIAFYNEETTQLLVDTLSEGHIEAAAHFEIFKRNDLLEENWHAFSMGVIERELIIFSFSGQFGELSQEVYFELLEVLQTCFGKYYPNSECFNLLD